MYSDARFTTFKFYFIFFLPYAWGNFRDFKLTVYKYPPPPRANNHFYSSEYYPFFSLIVNMFGAGLSPTPTPPTPPQLRVNI